MGKTLKYVSEFSFPSDKGYSGSAGQQMVKGYARGGSCEPMIAKAKGGGIPAPKKDMLFSKKEVNAKNLLSDGKAPSLPHAKGSVTMKNGGPVKPAPANRPPNVAPPQPPVPVRMAGGSPQDRMMNQAQMRAAAQGGQPPGRMMAKGGAAKVGKVMGEFKEGDLHSGSKSGPAVKSRKQAIAIGLSEARRGKK
jgi:hypothetical protein